MDGVHTTRGRRGAPPSGQRLTRDAVVSAAVAVIAEDGLADFSLRGLAGMLGVAPNALYNHVRGRDDLLDAVTERFVAGIRLPDAEQPWPVWLRSVATELRAQLIERPGLAELMLTRAGTTATGPRLLGQVLDRLVAAGVDRAVARVAWHAVLTVVIGSFAQDRAFARDRGRIADRQATFDAVLDMVIAGLRAAARQSPSAEAVALLRDHRLAGG